MRVVKGAFGPTRLLLNEAFEYVSSPAVLAVDAAALIRRKGRAIFPTSLSLKEPPASGFIAPGMNYFGNKVSGPSKFPKSSFLYMIF